MCSGLLAVETLVLLSSIIMEGELRIFLMSFRVIRSSGGGFSDPTTTVTMSLVVLQLLPLPLRLLLRSKLFCSCDIDLCSSFTVLGVKERERSADERFSLSFRRLLVLKMLPPLPLVGRILVLDAAALGMVVLAAASSWSKEALTSALVERRGVGRRRRETELEEQRTVKVGRA